MDEAELESSGISKKLKILLFFILLAISYAASTFAATITINTNNRIEFGQGIYYLKACDSFVNINYEAVLIDNSSFVKKVYVYGFDVTKCSNRYFRITPKSSNASDYLYSYGAGLNDKSRVVDLYVNASAKVSLVRNQTLVGQPILNSNTEYGDAYQTISYASGVYTITLANPLLLSANLTGTTFESSNDPFTNA